LRGREKKDIRGEENATSAPRGLGLHIHESEKKRLRIRRCLFTEAIRGKQLSLGARGGEEEREKNT